MTERPEGAMVRPPVKLRVALLAIPCAGAALFGLVCLSLVDGLHESLLAPLRDYPHFVAERYLDLQGLAMTIGRLDVPCDSLGWEAFQIDGRCYGLWGLAPSWLRIMLNGVLPQYFGHWSRVMVLAAALLAFLDCILIGRLAFTDRPEGWRKQAWVTGFALTMCLGGPLTFVVSNPNVYDEPVLWASAFALLACWALIAYDEEQHPRFVRLCIAALFLSLNSRLTVGVGIAAGAIAMPLAPFLQAWPRLQSLLPSGAAAMSRRIAAAILAAGAIVVASPLAVNVAKFGQVGPPVNRVPFFYLTPARLAHAEDGPFQLGNLRCELTRYLSPDTIVTARYFPWIHSAQPTYWEAGRQILPGISKACLESDVQSIEPSISLTDGAPALMLLLMAGLPTLFGRWRAIGRRWAPAVAGTAISGGFLLFFNAFAQRYMVDFFPLLVVGGAWGWRQVADLREPLARLSIVAVLGILVVEGMVANFGVALNAGVMQPYVFRLAHDIRTVFGEP